MKKKEQNHFYRLYSGRRRLTIQEKESIFDSVVEKTLRKSPGKNRLRWGLRAVFAAALALVAAVPAVRLYQRSQEGDELQARGEDPKPVFSITCLSSDGSAGCRQGDKLAFRLRSVDASLYFAAFSRHDKSGTIIWYFPATSDGRSVPVADTIKGGLLGEGIVIGEEHAPGEYEVFGLFSRDAMTRDEIRALFEEERQEMSEDEPFVQRLKVYIEQ